MLILALLFWEVCFPCSPDPVPIWGFSSWVCIKPKWGIKLGETRLKIQHKENRVIVGNNILVLGVNNRLSSVNKNQATKVHNKERVSTKNLINDRYQIWIVFDN